MLPRMSSLLARVILSPTRLRSLRLARTAVSELGARLWENDQAFAQRDLSEYEIAYLFVDGIAERLVTGHRSRPCRRSSAVCGRQPEGRAPPSSFRWQT
jgi:hypothetical protein